MPQPFFPAVSFQAFNLRDMLEAREVYHSHLSHLNNVIATAVRLYWVLLSNLDEHGKPWVPLLKPRSVKSEPCTLANSAVLPGYSWPCVMVFARTWQQDRLNQIFFVFRPSEPLPRSILAGPGVSLSAQCLILKRSPPRHRLTLM